MTLSPQFLDELRARTLLSSLIGQTTKLQKAGREFRACCPFHNEKTPSFYVNDDKGFYHCFGCSAHGDAIRWMTDQRGLPFMDAVKELAQNAGMDLPAMDPRAAEKAEAAKGLHEACADAASWFTDQLNGLAGAEARSILQKRGIKQETARAFGLGYAPDSRGKLKDALKDYGDPLLIEAGLLISVEQKAPYDRFRGRLMIPIRDPRGRTVAFGGRIIGDGEPKYLNSPETPLFDKGRTLYNLDRAGAAARKTGRVLVVEGYMDVIALAQAGFEEAVAPLGTALTEAQLERLWRMSDVPILCLDGDSAGQKAAIRAAHRALPMLAPGRSLAFVTLPQGQDPDDLVRAKGAAAFETLLKTPEQLVDKLWSYELALEPHQTPEQKAGLKARLSELAGSIADPSVRKEYESDFNNRFYEFFRAQRRPPAQPAQKRPQGKRGAPGQWKPPIEPPTQYARAVGNRGVDPILAKAVIAGLLRHPHEIGRHMAELGRLHLADDELQRITEKLVDLSVEDTSAGKTLDSEGLLTILAASGFDIIAHKLLRADQLSCSFTQKDAEPAQAREDLDEAIAILVSRPEVDAALAYATAEMQARSTDATFDWDGAFERQVALVKEQQALDARLANLMQANEDARVFSAEGN
jgi:DNA primase